MDRERGVAGGDGNGHAWDEGEGKLARGKESWIHRDGRKAGGVDTVVEMKGRRREGGPWRGRGWQCGDLASGRRPSRSRMACSSGT